MRPIAPLARFRRGREDHSIVDAPEDFRPGHRAVPEVLHHLVPVCDVELALLALHDVHNRVLPLAVVVFHHGDRQRLKVHHPIEFRLGVPFLRGQFPVLHVGAERKLNGPVFRLVENVLYGTFAGRAAFDGLHGLVVHALPQRMLRGYEVFRFAFADVRQDGQHEIIQFLGSYWRECHCSTLSVTPTR